MTDMLTTKEVKGLLKINGNYLRYLVRAKKLNPIKLDNAFLFNLNEIEEFSKIKSEMNEYWYSIDDAMKISTYSRYSLNILIKTNAIRSCYYNQKQYFYKKDIELLCKKQLDKSKYYTSKELAVLLGVKFRYLHTWKFLDFLKVIYRNKLYFEKEGTNKFLTENKSKIDRLKLRCKNRSYPEVHLDYYLSKENISLDAQYKILKDKGYYKLDLADIDKKINIEIDGEQWHSTIEQIEKDKKRDKYLESLGWKVMRFTAKEVINNCHEVIDKIKKVISS